MGPAISAAILFFVFYGLNYFLPHPVFGFITAVAALAVALIMLIELYPLVR